MSPRSLPPSSSSKRSTCSLIRASSPGRAVPLSAGAVAEPDGPVALRRHRGDRLPASTGITCCGGPWRERAAP